MIRSNTVKRKSDFACYASIPYSVVIELTFGETKVQAKAKLSVRFREKDLEISHSKS